MSMSTQTGFAAARDWCLAVETMNQEAISTGAERPDFSRMAAMFDVEIAKQFEHREAFLLAVSEFVSLALDGCVIIPSDWRPLV
jgi:hypothetical protein